MLEGHHGTMVRRSKSGGREREATIELLEALGSSLDIRVILERAYPALLRLVPADYGALGSSSSGKPQGLPLARRQDSAGLLRKLPGHGGA
jgi:hypothetical protein